MAAGERTHYDTLGVPSNASPEVIRAAHAKAREKFRALNDKVRLRAADTAFVVLSDKSLRAQYDRQIGAIGAAPAPAQEPYRAATPPGPAHDPYRSGHEVPSRDPFASRSSAAAGAAAGHSSASPYDAPSRSAGLGNGGAMLPPPAAPRRRNEEEWQQDARPLSQSRIDRMRGERMDLARDAMNADEYAGFWRRLLAGFADSILVAIPAVLAGVVVGILQAVLHLSPGSTIVLSLVATYGVMIMYHVLFLSSGKVATPGRALLGIAMLDATSGEPVATGQAFARTLLSMISWGLIVPNLFGLFNRRKQSLADMAMNTVVVRYKPANVLVVLLIGVVAVIGTGILAAVAIPFYQGYVKRAQVAVVMLDLSLYAQMTGQHMQTKGVAPPSLDELPYRPQSKNTTFSINRRGEISAEFKAARENAVITLYPAISRDTGAIDWQCSAKGLPPDWMPEGCDKEE